MTISPRGPLGAIAPLTNENGVIERTSLSGPWIAPTEVSIDGEFVVTPMNQEWRPVSAERGLLEGFLRLANGPDEAIATYGRKWGHVAVCRDHLLPTTHMRSIVAEYVPITDQCSTLVEDGAYRVPIAVWRQWARQAKAILEIAAHLKDDEFGPAEQWEAITEDGLAAFQAEVRGLIPWPVRQDEDGRSYVFPPSRGKALITSTTERRSYLRREIETRLGRATALQRDRDDIAEAINRWLEIVGVDPRFTWHRDRTDLMLTGGNLLGAIGVQLPMAIGRVGGLAICSGCGRAFVPYRRPAASRRRYCQDCGVGAAKRDAVADYRKRIKEGRHGKTRKR